MGEVKFLWFAGVLFTMDGQLYFDQLNIGDHWRSRGRTVTEAEVMAFAGLTGDYDPLHVDAEFARQSPYGERIAHGLLGISFLAGLNSNCPAVHTVSFIAIREWQFLKPIFFGDTVYGFAEILDLKPNINRRGQVIWRRTLLNQRDESVQSGIVETLVSLSPQPSATPPGR